MLFRRWAWVEFDFDPTVSFWMKPFSLCARLGGKVGANSEATMQGGSNDYDRKKCNPAGDGPSSSSRFVFELKSQIPVSPRTSSGNGCFLIETALL